MEQAWRDVVYAQEEGDFRRAWNEMLVCFGTQQRAIIGYIISEYLPWGEQFLQYQIKRYRNFGQRTNSPTETAHKDVKSYLIVGTGDLLHLDTAIRQMLVKKKHDYLQEAARQEVKLRRHYVGKD